MFIIKLKKIYTNNKRLINNIAGTYLIKGASLFISLFSLPAYMNYFSDKSVLGVWFTILAVLQWILMFDLGVGNGLRNKLVPALVKNDKVLMKKYISSSYIIIGFVSFVVLIIGSIIILTGSWNIVLNISPDTVSSDVLQMVLLLIFTGIIPQFFLRLITSILFAMQKVAVSNFISLISSVLILVYVLLFNTGNIEKDLINLALVNILTINVPLLFATVIIFITTLKESRPSLKFYDKELAFSILKLSGNFFWIQLALLFMNSTNEMLITWFYGPEYVVEYQVYYRLFYLVVTLFSLITNPVWSAISSAYSKKQYKWIVSLNKKLKAIVFFVTLCNFTLIFFSQTVIDIWLQDESFAINYGYGGVFVIFSAITMYNMASSVFANGMGDLKCQMVCYSIAAIVKIPLVVILSYFINDWIVVIVVNIFINIPYSVFQPRILNNLFKRLLAGRVVGN